MVYSTCSLNPIEDEAVIASLLEKSEGKHVGCIKYVIFKDLVYCYSVCSPRPLPGPLLV